MLSACSLYVPEWASVKVYSPLTLKSIYVFLSPSFVPNFQPVQLWAVIFVSSDEEFFQYLSSQSEWYMLMPNLYPAS